MAGPLDGIRVIDCANWVAAPAAAGLMADMGADVIKIEPPAGDTYRGFVQTQHPDSGILPGWENDNRGKRGVALDLSQEAGREALHRLCDTADIVITNFVPERIARYGLDYELLRERNPRLIYALLSGYGSRGAEANRLGYDFLAFWSRGGAMSVVGDVSGPPVLPVYGMGDHTTSLTLLSGLLVALRLRDQDGQGRRVEVSLQHAGLWTVSYQVQEELLGLGGRPKADRIHPTNPIANTYQTADGRWMTFLMPQIDRDWPRFCRALGRPAWAEEFADFDAVTAHASELRVRIEERFAEHTLEEWRPRLDAEGLLWEPVAEIAEVAADPQLRGMDSFDAIEHPRAGSMELVSAPFHVEDAEIEVRRHAPEIGEHTHEVLAEVGLTTAEIAELAERRAFG